jgi:hypothetical protein
MDFWWARANKFLLACLVIAVAVVGVLSTLVMRQQDDQDIVNGQVSFGIAPTVPPVGFAAGAGIGATPNAVTHPAPATTPDSANTPVGPTSPPAPASPVFQATPPPSVQKPLKPKTLPRRRVDPAPTPHPSAAAHPVASVPDPDPLTRSDTPVKPGSPEGW